MFREVRSPDGVPWRVEIDWIARRVRNPFRRSIEIIRERRAARRARKDEGKDKWYDNVDCVDCPAGDLDDLVVGVLVVLALALLVAIVIFVFPFVWAVLAVLVEFFFVTIAAILVLIWRTATRRPWRVVARRTTGVDGDGTGEGGSAIESWTTEVVGYRAARARVHDVADRLTTGMPPGDQGLTRRHPAGDPS